MESLWDNVRSLLTSDRAFAFFIGFLLGYIIKAIKI